MNGRASQMNATDQLVQDWNATVAAGDAAEIRRLQRQTLRELAQLVMDDDDNYSSAGWTR